MKGNEVTAYSHIRPVMESVILTLLIIRYKGMKMVCTGIPMPSMKLVVMNDEPLNLSLPRAYAIGADIATVRRVPARTATRLLSRNLDRPKSFSTLV